MTVVLWLAGVLAMTGFGTFVTRFDYVRKLERPARWAIVFATGLVCGGVLMSLYTLVGLSWTRVTLGIALVLAALLGKRGERIPMRGWTWSLIGLAAALTTYGSLTARQTIADLLLFWGPKGVHFYQAEKLDFVFLATPHYFLMHSDYPPLLPLLYAFGAVAAHEVSYLGAVVFSSVCIIAAAVAFRGMARMAIGEVPAAAFASLLAMALAYGVANANAAGGADPLLVFLEVVAIAALTFDHGNRGAHLIAAIALAGVVLVKVEGAAFAAVILFAHLLAQRRWRTTLLIALPSTLALGAWVYAVFNRHIADAYASRNPFQPDTWREVVYWTIRRAAYRAAYLPWIAALVPLFLGRNFRRAAFPLLVTAGSIAAMFWFYLHQTGATRWWIESSAERVLLTPLASLIIAAAAAARDQDVVLESPAYGVVPQREEAEGSGRETGRDSRGPLDQM